MRKIFTDFPICGTFELSADDARHVVLVLRHTVGDTLPVTDVTGTTYECFITRIEGHSAYLTPAKKLSDPAASTGMVTLAAGILKGDKFDWVIQKATELGAYEIVAFPSSRCVMRLDAAGAQKKLDRWQKIAASAAAQSGRGRIPQVLALPSFADAVKRAAGCELALLPYENEHALSLRRAVGEAAFETVSIMTGPEGGFSEDEVRLAQEAGMQICTLGPRILRCETAPLCALSAVLYAAGALD